MAALKKFLTRYPDCTILATCRRRQNQGRFTGSIEEQIKILEAAREAGAQAVDIEIESAENCENHLAHLRSETHLVLSYHNYGGTPPRLESVLRRMAAIPAHAYKIVTTARKPSDNSRVLSLARAHPKIPTVLLAMGETGFPTRVLSPSFGGLYTYAAPNMAGGTASGQVSAKKLRGHVSRGETFARRENLRSDRRSGGALHFAGGAQPGFPGSPRGCGLSAVPGASRAAQGFFRDGRGSAFGGFQRDDPAQAEDPAVSGLGGSGGAPHRSGEYGVAQGRQVARREYRRSRRHLAAGASRAAEQIVGSGGGQRRRGSRSRLRAGGGGQQAGGDRTQSGSRARARFHLRRRGSFSRTGGRTNVRRAGARHAARHGSECREVLLRRTHSVATGVRHGVHAQGHHAAAPRQRPGRGSDPGARNVPGTGRAAVRNLHRGASAEGCDGAGRAGGSGGAGSAVHA